MNVTFDKTGNLEGVISVRLDKADYADKVTQELKEIGKTRDIPGFRKGHVDINQLRKRFGKDVRYKVINDMAIDAVFKYIEDNKLDLLGQPLPAVGHDFNLDDDDVTFKYEVGLAPEVKLALDKSTTIDYYNIAVSDEMIAEQSKSLLAQAGTQEPGQEYAPRALVKGSMLQLADDGQVKADGIQVETTIVAPFTFKSEAEAAKFEGTKVGDKVVFNPFDTCDGNEAEVASMLHIDRDKVEEGRSNFELTITEFIVHKPAEENQEFYNKVFGEDVVHNSEEFRAQVIAMIERALQPNSRQLFVRTAEDYLMDTYGTAMELPEAFLKRFMLATNKNLVDADVDAAYNENVPAIKWELIESKASEQLGVKVSEEDVKMVARMRAVEALNNYGMGHMAEQMADYYAENMLKDEKQKRALAHQAFTNKLFAAIHNAVSLNEKTVSLDEFREIVSKLNASTEPEVAAEEE